MELRNKVIVIVVTGGVSGIGLALVAGAASKQATEKTTEGQA